MRTLHVPSPLQLPSHPSKEWPLCGAAVRVTLVPSLKSLEQPVAAATPAVMRQLIPAGLEVTTPFPVPWPVTVNRRVTRAAVPVDGWVISERS
jgi:hypothetical protein